MAGKACHVVASTTRFGLTQALGLASETSVARATQRSFLAMFRAAALALHSPQPTFVSFKAGHARFHQALPVRTLAPFPGFSRFARRRTRQQALPRVPARECEIFTGEQLFAGRAKAGLRPNNSFKPSPLRGLDGGPL